eukprot:TRINITY_DN75632_c0_g1_i1.p1 TRINITY_DN75632_c0_g1~~TRINITY_DN75632_c0_g1_i1.p1  ORF type:complete len:291 (-),score=22.66 TRINITY_DN75632_c0_g1_i1:40-834(-)
MFSALISRTPRACQIRPPVARLVLLPKIQKFASGTQQTCRPPKEALEKWSASECLRDHVSVAASLPKILGAYVGQNAIAPKLNESIMVTVNSANKCPYCSGLHGQLARMAGVEDATKLESAESADEARKVVDEEAITYARIFAENRGRGEKEQSAFEELVRQYGTGKAGSIRALCWFLQWGSLGGNTLNAILNGSHSGNLAFRVLYGLYYGPLFLVIAVMNRLLVFFPTVPTWFSASIGVVLTFVAGSWLIPVAIVGAVASPLL